MRAIMILFVLAGLGLLLGSTFLLMREGVKNNGSFAARLDRPIRLAILGTPDRAEAMRAEILSRDVDGLIDREAALSEISEADALLFLLDGWKEIENAPWQEKLKSDYAIISESSDGSFSLAMGDGDRPLNRTYYNLRLHPNWDATCYAELYLHEVGGTPGTGLTLPATCAD